MLEERAGYLAAEGNETHFATESLQAFVKISLTNRVFIEARATAKKYLEGFQQNVSPPFANKILNPLDLIYT